MFWLNWSLKLHIRLRTISFLISTHITHVYVQWMPYLFVWLYLINCVFTCSIFVDQTQKDLWLFSCFWKVFCFYKNCQNFKNSVAPFWWLSRRLVQLYTQSQAHTEIFCDSLAGQCPSREKYLEYISKFGFFLFLTAQCGDLFVGGRSSREGYIEIFAAYLVT